MTDSSDYRLFLKSEFKGIHDEMGIQFTSINGKLRDVNDHLSTLNGKVARHEKIINELCLSEKLEEQINERQRIADELAATNRRDRRFVTFQIIALVLTLIGVSTGAYFGFRTNEEIPEIKSEQKVTNDILYDAKTRGKCYTPPIFKNDTIQ